MRFKHTHRPGFWLGFIDFFTAGLFFLLYMPLGGLQEELDEILGRRTLRYWIAYLLGVPTAFIYPLVWMSRIAEELKMKAMYMGIEGPYTSWWHMFGWNVFGILLMGPAVAPGAMTVMKGLAKTKPSTDRTTENAKINLMEKENTREAFSRLPLPSRTDIWTDAPVAIMLEMASMIMMTGMIRLTAAKASSPRKRPTKSPSTTEYSAPKTAVTTSGSAQRKKSLVGGVVANISESIFLPSS